MNNRRKRRHLLNLHRVTGSHLVNHRRITDNRHTRIRQLTGNLLINSRPINSNRHHRLFNKGRMGKRQLTGKRRMYSSL
jgi:hypothetical protein